MVSYDFCVVLYDTENRLLMSIHTSHILSVYFCLLALESIGDVFLFMCTSGCLRELRDEAPFLSRKRQYLSFM